MMLRSFYRLAINTAYSTPTLHLSGSALAGNAFAYQQHAQSLTQHPQFAFASKGQAPKKLSPAQRRKKNQRRAKRPDLFKPASRIRPPNLLDPKLHFPITIPVKFYYVYRPLARKQRAARTINDNIRFKYMSGNEILINLENPSNLRPSEICSALLELAKRKAPKDVDWNQHEWIQKTVEFIKSKISQWKAPLTGYIAVACDRLELNDQELWRVIEANALKTMHLYKPKGFGFAFVAFQRKQRGSEEFRKKLASRLPIFLKSMSPHLITRCFELIVENGLLNDHIFDNHFHVLFWRRHYWFGPQCYPTIIRTLAKIKHENDPEFWDDSFLPAIKRMKLKLNETSTQNLLDALRSASQQLETVKFDEYITFLEEHLLYCKTKLKALENARFYNIVLNDLAYYREKQKLKMAGGASTGTAAAAAQ